MKNNLLARRVLIAKSPEFAARRADEIVNQMDDGYPHTPNGL